MSIEIANESGIDVDESHLAGLARHVLDDMRVHPLAELSVLLVDEPAMTELHVRWMGEEGPTDVLAFPMDELQAAAAGGHARRPRDSRPGCRRCAARRRRDLSAGGGGAGRGSRPRGPGRDRPALHARDLAPARATTTASPRSTRRCSACRTGYWRRGALARARRAAAQKGRGERPWAGCSSRRSR